MEESGDDELHGNKKPPSYHTEHRAKITLPDGGYGWVVTFASFMCHFIADGIAFTFGVIYSDLLSSFGASKSTTSWVGSLFVGIPLLCGPLAGVFVSKYGCRSSAIFGGIITSLGMLLSSFANSIEMLCFTYGILAGFGLAFVYVPASVIPSFWFEKKRALATGLAVSGSGLGTFAVAPLIEFLIEEYGWRGTLLILSAITLNFMVFGALFREVPISVAPLAHSDSVSSIGNLSSLASCQSFRSLNIDVRSTESRTLDNALLDHSPRHNKNISTNTVVSGADFKCLVEVHPPTSNIKHDGIAERTGSQTIPLAQLFRSHRSLIPLSRFDFTSVVTLAARQRTISSCPELSMVSSESIDSIALPRSSLAKFTHKLRKVIVEMCDIRLFAVPVYLLFFLSNFTLAYAYDLPYIYLPDYANEQNISNSSFLISIIGIVNTFGQVLFGFLGDRKSVNTLVLYGVSIFLCGVIVSIIPLLHSYAALATISALFGLFISANFSLETVVLVKILSLEQLTKAYSLLMFGQGVASLIGPPIGGKCQRYVLVNTLSVIADIR